MAGPDHLGRTRAWSRAPAVLPAVGATLGTSVSGGTILVAHTGTAHLGAVVGGDLLRDLERAEAAVAHLPPTRPGDSREVARAELPEVIPFRHATSYAVGVTDGDVHLTLIAEGEAGKPDVRVEVRMDRPLLDRLAEHRRRQRRATLVACLHALAVLGAILAILA